MSSSADQWIWIAVAAAVALVVLPLVWWLARRTLRHEVDRLKDDVHALLANPRADDRLVTNGREGAFVDIAASVNRLLDRRGEGTQALRERGGLFEALAHTLPEVALVHTTSILFANRAAGELFGVEPEALVGKPVTDLLRPAYRAVARKHMGQRLEGEAPSEPLEVQLIGGEERGLWVELYCKRVTWRGQRALLTVARDVSHRKTIEAALGRGKLQARITLESIGEGVITTDPAGIIDYMNEAAEQLIGTMRSAALGKRLLDLIALVDEADRQSLGDPVLQCLSERRRVNLGRRALLVSKVSEREFSTELTASPIRGPDGQVAGCVVIFHDVSELRVLAREMSYQAAHDALTGLVNRAEFERRLEASVKSGRSDDVMHVVCYLDLDRFKIVNDSCGHLVGDNLLREIAALLKQKVRDSDTVARVGGDEFAMLLVACPLEKALQIAQDVC
ncbi:MAG TPA: diguanylate cyclase, partial [Gammaproteobacteria bacterium]|nr:diguanylate cyclase [Gammaproteobacteria bacterium]